MPQIAAAEAALRAYWAEAAELVPRLLPHMAVYAAALHAPLFAKGTQTTLAVVFGRCAHLTERVLQALVEHAGADLSGRYPLVFGTDEEAEWLGKPLTPLEYVLGYWQREHLCDLCRLFAFDALLKKGADAGAFIEAGAGGGAATRSMSLPAFLRAVPPGRPDQLGGGGGPTPGAPPLGRVSASL